MTAFIIGPSAGYFEGNRPYFDWAAKQFERKADIVNPLAFVAVGAKPIHLFEMLLGCDTILAMPGWEKDEQMALFGQVAKQIGCKFIEIEPPATGVL